MNEIHKLIAQQDWLRARQAIERLQKELRELDFKVWRSQAEAEMKRRAG
jgi:hypothetical protein